MKIFWLRLQIISFLFIMLQILEAASVQSAPEEASRRIFGLIINSDFDGAIRSADSCIHYDSLQPLYQVLKLSALGLQDMDYDRIIDTTRFLQSYETTLSAITAREESAGVTSATLAFRGFAYAIHASFYLLHKQYFSALNTGFASLDWMEKAKKMDETNFDPDLIIGAYKCAKGELKKRLWMVLFWYPGSRKQGIEHLERCSRQGTIGAAVAQLALIDLYTKDSRFNEAEKLLDSMTLHFPQSRFLLWSRIRYYEALKKHREAAELYGQLSLSYQKQHYGEKNAVATKLSQIKALKKGNLKSSATVLAAQAAETLCTSVTDPDARKLCKEILKEK